MPSISKLFGAVLALATTACSTATAAPASLCDAVPETVMIEQNKTDGPSTDDNLPRQWALPDEGTYPGPNGEKLTNKWLNLQQESPTSLVMWCYMPKRLIKLVPLPASTPACTWVPGTGTVSCP